MLNLVCSFAFYNCINLLLIFIPDEASYTYQLGSKNYNGLIFLGTSCFEYHKLIFVQYNGLRSPEYYSINLFNYCKVTKVIVPQDYLSEQFCF